MARSGGWVRYVRWAVVLVVTGFLAVLAWYLPAPGFSLSRLGLFGALAVAAVGGAVGVLRRRADLTVGGAFTLALLGVWQAVLSLFVWPVVVVLLLAAAGISDSTGTSPEPQG